MSPYSSSTAEETRETDTLAGSLTPGVCNQGPQPAGKRPDGAGPRCLFQPVWRGGRGGGQALSLPPHGGISRTIATAHPSKRHILPGSTEAQRKKEKKILLDKTCSCDVSCPAVPSGLCDLNGCRGSTARSSTRIYFILMRLEQKKLHERNRKKIRLSHPARRGGQGSRYMHVCTMLYTGFSCWACRMQARRFPDCIRCEAGMDPWSVTVLASSVSWGWRYEVRGGGEVGCLDGSTW